MEGEDYFGPGFAKPVKEVGVVPVGHDFDQEFGREILFEGEDGDSRALGVELVFVGAAVEVEADAAVA